MRLDWIAGAMSRAALATAPAAAVDDKSAAAPVAGAEKGFSQQQIGAAVSKLVSASIGEIAVVFSRSAQHKHYTFADLEWMILPAVVSGQFYVAELAHKDIGARAPVATVLWASVSDVVSVRLAANPKQKIRLRPDEWKSGANLWIVDTAGEPRAIAGALTHLAQTQFRDKHVNIIMPGADGQAHIEDLHALLACAAAINARAG